MFGTLCAHGAELRILTDRMPDARVGQYYSEQLAVEGGTPPYKFQITSGLATPGYSLSVDGRLSGTGSYAVVYTQLGVRVEDATRASVTRSIYFQVRADQVRFDRQTFPDGVVGVPYNGGVNGQSTQAPPYEIVHLSGSVPGLYFSRIPPAGAGFFGEPTVAGSYPVTLKVSDSDGNEHTQQFTIKISPRSQPQLSTQFLGKGVRNQPYEGQLQGVYGQTPYTFSVIGGNFPSGLQMSNSGLVSGTPLTAGSFTFQVQLRDALGATASGPVTLNIDDLGLKMNLFPYGGAAKGEPFRFAFFLSGGVPYYSCKALTASLPRDFLITQVPPKFEVTFTPATTGVMEVQIQCSDATYSDTVSHTFQINVFEKPFGFKSTQLPKAFVGIPYQFQFEIYGDVSAARFGQTDSSVALLAMGLQIDPKGLMTGVPLRAGSLSFVITAYDGFETQISQAFKFDIEAPSLRIETSSLPTASLGQAYQTKLVATGGPEPFVFALQSGTLPQGLSLSSDGQIRGTPTQGGSFNFAASVRDGLQKSAQVALTLTVTGTPITITTTALPAGVIGVAYQQSISVSGGISPYQYQWIGATVPGLSLSTAGILSGTPTQAGTYPISIRVTDAVGLIANASLSLQVGSRPRVSVFAPPDGLLQHLYQFAFSAEGGRSPMRWSVKSGTLPNGTTLGSDGLLRGVVLAPGTYKFVVEVTDADQGRGDLETQIEVLPAILLPRATVGGSYQASLRNLSGLQLSSCTSNANALGQLPTGLQLDGQGEFSGRPESSGLYSFGVRCVIAQGVVTRAVSLRVDGESPVLPYGLAGASVGRPYRQQLSYLPNSVWQVAGGQLPAGLQLDATGLLHGTPNVAGNTIITVQATSGDRSVRHVYQLSIDTGGGPALDAVMSSASYEARGVAPGEILVLFGERMGGNLKTGNPVSRSIEGTRVLFDGVAAPLLYASKGQVSAIAPFGLAGRDAVRIVVEQDGVQSAPTVAGVVAAKPGLFSVNGSGEGAGAILNQNGSVNTEANPARAGEVVVLYLTGGGTLRPAAEDGSIASAASSLEGAVEVTIEGRKSQVLYAGGAPGLVAGAVQINVLLGQELPAGLLPIAVSVAGERSVARIGVWVR